MKRMDLSVRWLAVLLVAVSLLTGCRPTTAEGETSFRSDLHHLEVTLPAGWAAVEGQESLARPFVGLVAFNSWGEDGFWARQVAEEGSGGTSYTYSPQAIMDQVPDGGAYVVLVHVGGGPRTGPEEYGPEYEPQDLAGLWEAADCREGQDTPGVTWLDFSKWGRALRLEVYCRPDASGETAAAVGELLASWQFDGVPVGDPGWAVVQARQLLPPGVEPDRFPLWQGVSQTTEQLRTVIRGTQTEVEGQTVVVTFTFRWDVPWNVTDADRCPDDTCHWWRYQARPDGEVVLVETGGADLPEAASDTWPAGLVYRTTDGLWWVDPDGRPVLFYDPPDLLGPDGRPVFSDQPDFLLSPDARPGAGEGMILWVQSGEGEEDTDVWVMDLATGEQRNLTAAAGRIECCPQWWPARPDVILFGSRPSGPYVGPDVGFLTSVRVDGSEYRVLVEESPSIALPGPGPDGRTIAYDREGTAWLYDWESGRHEPFDPQNYGLSVQRIGSPSWSPDGHSLAWVVGGDFGSGGAWRIGLAVFDLEVDTGRVLHTYEPASIEYWPSGAVWSPDGEWLAYPAYYSPAVEYVERPVLRLERVDGTGGYEPAPGSGQVWGPPVWSPDSQWLAVSGECAVFLSHVRTTQAQVTGFPRNAVAVAWIAAEAAE